MKIFQLIRLYHDDTCTVGKFFDTNLSWDVIERPWKDNDPDVSCIPLGIYTCVYHNTAHLPDCWELQNVPNRTGICIHSANVAHELEGCIALGTANGMLGEDRAVFHSREALQELRDYVGRNEDGSLQSFQLQITNEY